MLKFSSIKPSLFAGVAALALAALGADRAMADRDPKCTGGSCPVCVYSGDSGSGTQSFGNATISIQGPPSFPTNSITYCIEAPRTAGDYPPLLCPSCPSLALTYIGLQYTMIQGCNRMTYCDENGNITHCQGSHENVDPPRAYPPEIVQHDGREWLHGCFTFNCDPPVPPAGCATPTPVPTSTPEPTATPGGGRSGE